MRKLIQDSLRKSDYIFFLTIGIVFYIIIRQYIPYIDDLNYSYVFWKDAASRYPVQSIGDIVESQIFDYFNANGRVVIHSIVQFCCSFPIGREFHFILTSLSFVILVSGMTMAVRKIHPYQNIDKYVILSGILLFFPCLGQLFLGRIAFSANYLWTGAAFIWLYNYFNLIKNRNETIPLYKGLMIFIISFLTAALNESFTIPFGAALFFYFLFNHKKLKGESVYLLAGFFAGACFMILAPSNFLRHENANISILTNLKNLFKSQIFIQFVLVNFIFVCVKGWNEFVCQIQRNAFFYCIVTTSFIFATIVIYMGERQLYVVEILMLVIVAPHIVGIIEKKQIVQQSVRLSSCVFALAVSLLLFNIKREIKTAWSDLENSISNSPDGIAVANGLYKLCKNHESDFTYTRYTDIGTLVQIVKYPCWNSITFDYYKRGISSKQKCILPDTPESIVQFVTQDDASNDKNIFYNAKNEYYVIRIDDNNMMQGYSPIVVCQNDYSHTAYGKLKYLLGKSHKTYENLSLDDLHHFHHNNTVYAIVYKGNNSSLSIK